VDSETSEPVPAPGGDELTSPPSTAVADPGAAPGDGAPGAGTAAAAGAGAAAEAARKRRRGRWAVEWAIVLVVALAVALGVRAYVVQTFFIPSASMEPTLLIGDRIIVDKLSYHLHDVHRGDIVVFGRPPGEAALNINDLVKRVIGLPGETISSQGDNVLINGHVLKEPWLTKGTKLGPPITPFVIPANDYFVMGDNRSDSQDSRFFGPIPRSLIVGRVVMRIWPLSHISFF